MPGFYISTIEEFSAKAMSYEEGGGVYSSKIGVPEYDMANHYVWIKPIKKLAPESLKVGDKFLGIVDDVKKNFAQITIYVPGSLGRLYPFSALLHISNGGIRRARAVSELVKPGDVIKVKLITNWVPMQVSISDPDLGVISARCSKCGSTLNHDHDGVLRCNTCGYKEMRKVSIEYRRIFLKGQLARYK